MQKVDVALVGAGGYGHFYLKSLLGEGQQHGANLVGIVDPTLDQLAQHPLFSDQPSDTIPPLYPDLASFYAQQSADLVIIVAPLHFHTTQTCTALANGSHVLCEKPLCATIQDANTMLRAEDESGKFVAVGYQWSFSSAIQSLKADILAGVLGKPIRLKSCVLWQRWIPYFTRNNWAGRIKTADGAWILDSPVNNATAHYLHNMFYLLGQTIDTSAYPLQIEAELYRVNQIENYDTAALRCQMGNGVELLFYSAQPVPTDVGPLFHLEFEKAIVTYQTANGGRSTDGPITAHFHDGHRKEYGDPFAKKATKLWRSIDAVRTGETLPCGIRAAMPHTICVNGAQESMSEIGTISESHFHTEGDQTAGKGWVEGLSELFQDCYAKNQLVSEHGGVEWAKAGKIINLENYHTFPSYVQTVR